MTVQSESENRLSCPNCQALNVPYAVICTSCGIKMDEFRAALPRLQQLKENQASSHRELLADEVEYHIKDDVHKSTGAFRKLILALLVFMVIAGVVVSISAYFYANRVKQSQAEIQARYEASLACLQEEKYSCAQDGFVILINSGINWPELAENLNQAQFGLAKQYFESGQWESAVSKLKDLLERDPGNQKAIRLLKESYNQWIKQLGIEGNWLKRWTVRRERDARFPPTY